MAKKLIGVFLCTILAQAFQTVHAQPANDMCHAAISLACGSVMQGSTLYSTADSFSLCGSKTAASHGVWYVFTGSGMVTTVTTCSPATTFDTEIRVFTGSCAETSCLSYNDDAFTCETGGSSVTFLADSGIVYLIYVSGYGQAAGNFELKVSCHSPPHQFCSQPQIGLPDGSGGITDTLSIDQVPGYIYAMQVKVDLSHPASGDVELRLESPSGTMIMLYEGICGAFADVKGVFTDSALLQCPVAYFQPAYPAQPLASFHGQPLTGTWKLHALDRATAESGILHSWCIEALTGTCGINSQCDDGLACTIDTCANGVCLFAPHNCTVSLSGRVITPVGQPVPGVVLLLSGDDSQTDTTAADGTYSFEVTQGGSYLITPLKTDDQPPAQGITTADITRIRRHILDLDSLGSPYAMIAADVNGSATITTQDIVQIRQLILGNSVQYSSGILWQFVSTDYLFPTPENPFVFESFRTYTELNSSVSEQNFIAVKLGDVNHSWTPAH
ncbi:MAG: hypothetical protein KatS3mg031_0053 [Chitinophagales bacterium]|nr:MAG: hypothetical protein KatS3mg031_0053 [Chitinophagales bacterium]